MSTFSFQAFTSALEDAKPLNGLDFSNKSLKLDSPEDAEDIIKALNQCKELTYLELKGNTLGVKAAEAIAKALEQHPEFKQARWSDLFTGRMKTEIPLALSALGQGMIVAKAKLSVLDLSDNAFGPIGVEGLARLLESEVCSQLQELRLNNNGLGITGGRLLAKALLALAPPLKVFIAGRNRLENEGAKALAEVFKKIGTLEEIAMPQNGIYHVGITALSIAFKSNTNLRILNLNDNTIGPKGAEAIAQALSSLKGLRDINFGDCLLKGKGAKVLAHAFKENSLQLENLDLSHNEIDVASSRVLVESVTLLPDYKERLHRVCLAGNGLGNATSKRALKESLGDAAALSDGEDDDDDGEIEIGKKPLQLMSYVDLKKIGDSDAINLRATKDEMFREQANKSYVFNASFCGNDFTFKSTHQIYELEFSDGSDSESEQEDSEQEEDNETDKSHNVTEDSNNVTEDSNSVAANSLNITANSVNVTANSVNVTATTHNDTEDSKNLTDDHDATTLAQNFLQVDLDITEVVTPRDSPVLKFLEKPNKENFIALGDEPAAVLDKYFQLTVRSQQFVDQYVEGIMKVSGLCESGTEHTEQLKCAKELYEKIFTTTHIRNVASWQITNSILQALGLLKKEEKLSIEWNLDGCYRVLSGVIREPYFCERVRDSIRCFVSSGSDRQSIQNRQFNYDKYINVICQ